MTLSPFEFRACRGHPWCTDIIIHYYPYLNFGHETGQLARGVLPTSPTHTYSLSRDRPHDEDSVW